MSVPSHIGGAERNRQHNVQTACADLGKSMRTWRHRLVFGAIRGRLAQQVGRVLSRGSSEPGQTTLACSCGLTVELSCAPGDAGPTTQTLYVLGKASVERQVARSASGGQRLVGPLVTRARATCPR